MTDRIVQLCLTKVDADGQREILVNTLVNPEMPISQGATDVHGITDSDVVNAPTFAQIAPQLEHHFSEADAVIGYNSSKFDNTMIDEEFLRCRSNFTVSSKPQIDVKRLLEHIVPRDLNSVSERYLNRTIEGAHDASVDVTATLDVMDALIALGGMSSLTSLEVSSTLSDGFITGDGRVVWDNNRAMISFGKMNGQYLYDAVRSDRRYFDWIVNIADPAECSWISRDLRNCIHMAIQAQDEPTFNRLLARTYGAPPHDCFEHIDVVDAMYQTEDGYEGHEYAQCNVCEKDLTEELEGLYEDYEPDEDMGRER
jgi:DNA polymerase-3 subunit epsilon